MPDQLNEPRASHLRDTSMPLLRIDVIEGRSKAELKELLDAIHSATLAAFKVPERDRYQIVHEHPSAEMRIEDTGLGIPRSERIVMVEVTTRPRSRLEKRDFYELLCQELLRRCGVKARVRLRETLAAQQLKKLLGMPPAHFC